MRNPHIPRFVRHVGIAAPFLRSDVELEIIAPLNPGLHVHGHTTYPPAPVSHLHQSDPDADGNLSIGLHSFEGIRYLPDGRENPEFVLNQEPYRNASILIAGENFGIGSTQAFAVLRLWGCGMRAVIAPSFGPVFYSDCFVYGMLPVTLGSEAIATIVKGIVANPRIEMTVDLERQVIERPGMKAIAFSMNARLRDKLLLGVDDLDEALKHTKDAEAFEKENRKRRPWIYQPGGDNR
jgi:3-isopropylmalate/(R)-2-methylmalate dehydratase small subunit